MTAPTTGILFYEGRAQPLSSIGLIQPGAYYQFYSTGTTTLANVYADGGLTTPLSQTPGTGGTTAAADGRLVPIYLSSSITYRYRLYNFLGVLLEDVDPFVPPVLNLSQSSIGVLLYPQTSSEITASVTPTNYYYPPGVIDRYGTNTVPGTTDMTTAVNAALSVANAGGGSVVALAKTYAVQTINWPGNNISLVGTGSGFSMDTGGTPYTKFKFLSTSGGTTVISLAQTGTAEDRQGNYLSNFEIDGNNLATVGFDTVLGNTLERVSIKNTLVIGARFFNFTNGNLATRCKFSNNSGWGFRAEGSSTTTYTLRDCEIISNTLGGLDLQAGVNVLIDKCDIESNAGPGIQINKDNTMTGSMFNFDIRDCWFEGNASTSPFFTVVINSGTSDLAHSPIKIRFDKCRFNASSATNKHVKALVCQWVTFKDCNFDTSTASDAITLSSNSRYVSFIGSSTQSTYSLGLSPTQLDNAIAQGAFCWTSDPDVKRIVGSGAPAAAFQNSWQNFGGTASTAKYWFNTDGEVCLEGNIKSGSSGTVAFTLPIGYRPQTGKVFVVDANNAFGTVNINTDGTVLITGSTTLTSLDGIRFPTD